MENLPAFAGTPVLFRGSSNSSNRSALLSKRTEHFRTASFYMAQAPERASPVMWFSNLFETFFGLEKVCIPQADSKPNERLRALDKAKSRYEWTKEGVANAAMIKGLVLPEERPRIIWLEGLIAVIIRTVRNARAAAKQINSVADPDDDDKNALMGIEEASSRIVRAAVAGSIQQKDVEQAIKDIGIIMDDRLPSGSGNTFDDYKSLYKVLELDIIAKNDQFLTDEIFGWYRVAGSNTMRLRKAFQSSTHFPELSDEIFSKIPGFEKDSLSKAAAEDRLYFVEYPELEDVVAEKPGRYVYSPTALFAVPEKAVSLRHGLLPIAVRCSPGARLYTPCDDKVAWLAAKYVVQNADMLLQTVVYHLARCHLLIEVFICSTHRALAPSHPVYKLLLNHFYGTALMNFAATKTLVQDGGPIDKVIAPSMSTSRQLAADSINDPSMCFNDWMPDTDLRRRGVMSEKLQYPYRDDALAVWNALLKFVTAYVNAYYSSDTDVASDPELQAWCSEITRPEGGNLPGFGENGMKHIQTREYLVRVVSMVIFTASAQHASTNHTQAPLMQYAPSMAFSLYAKAPETDKPWESIDAFVRDMMPPLEAASGQITITEVLGTLRYSRLGDYGGSLKYAPKSVQAASTQFREDLEKIAVAVGNRNEVECRLDLPPYDYLHPKNIPASINI